FCPDNLLSVTSHLVWLAKLVSVPTLILEGVGMTRITPIAVAAGLAIATILATAPANAITAGPHAIDRPASDVITVAQRKAVPQKYKRRVVRFTTNEKPGTIIVDTNNKFLYYVEGKNRATRYGIGVGRE